MSSFLCFVCHSTVNSDTNEEIREKYRDIVGMNLCPDSQLCYICCQIVHKLSLFKAYCLKRSLEYPVLFSEKGTTNIQRSEVDYLNICPENANCEPTRYSTYSNTKTFIHKHDPYNEGKAHVDDSSNQYVDLQKDRIYEHNENEHFMYNKNDQQNNYDTNFDDFPDIDNDDEWRDNIDDVYRQRDNTNAGNCEDTNDNAKDPHDGITNDRDDGNDTKVNYDNEANMGFSNEANMGYVSNDDSNTDTNLDYIDEDYNNTNNTKLSINTTQQDITESITQDNHNATTDNHEDTNITESTVTVKLKNKKVKIKSFEKIVLSLKEQKTALEEQRREKKYIDAQFKCHSCALGFLFKDTYQSHMVRHEESNGQYSCGVCKLRFATQNARCMHVILHSEIHRCNKCGAEVKRPHRARHSRHCWGEVTPHTCHLCGKDFRDANCLQQHIKRFHEAKTNKRIYSCNVCGKTYTEQNAVRTHMLTHVNRTFDCPTCRSSFTSPYTLNQHMKVHDPARPRSLYHCHTCDRSYDTKKSLLAHFNRTGLHRALVAECPLCPRKFPTSNAASRHVQTCHGPAAATSAQCTRCGSRHVSREALARHVRRHAASDTPAVEVVCHLCGNTYKGQNKLNRHLKEVCGRAQLEEQLASFYDAGQPRGVSENNIIQ